MREGQVTDLPYRVCFAGGDDIIVGRSMLERQPHRLHIVACEAPIAPGVKISKDEPVGQPQLNHRHSVRYLAGDEVHATSRALMVVQNAGTCKQPSLLTVNGSDPVAESLGYAVRITRLKWSRFCLRHFCGPAKDLAAGGLSEAYSGVNSMNGVEQLYDH